MNKILNITNGDCAVNIMKEAKISGTFLPWQDVLHEGPVPADISLEALSKVRAQFIHERGWIPSEAVATCFNERDALLNSYNDFDQVILWFEHDLYDQLQLLQLLDWFSEQSLKKTRLSIICNDQYLGMLTPAQMSALVGTEKDVTQAQLDLSKKAWAAFRASSPTAWHSLLKEDTSTLPFLEGAIIRMMEEYPNTKNGLPRVASQTLQILATEALPAGKLFGRYIETEERQFLGDSSFWTILRNLLDASPPLIALPKGIDLTSPTKPDQILSITETGIDVLAEKKNWLDHTQINYWIGGTHLHDESIWYWDPNLEIPVKSLQ